MMGNVIMFTSIKKLILKTPWLNSKAINLCFCKDIHGVGKVSDLKIDFTERKVQCNLNLNGEFVPVKFFLNGFELIKSEPDNRYYIKIASAQVSKEWLHTLASRFAVGKQIEIDENIYKTLAGMFEK